MWVYVCMYTCVHKYMCTYVRNVCSYIYHTWCRSCWAGNSDRRSSVLRAAPLRYLQSNIPLLYRVDQIYVSVLYHITTDNTVIYRVPSCECCSCRKRVIISSSAYEESPPVKASLRPLPGQHTTKQQTIRIIITSKTIMYIYQTTK